MKSGEYYSHYYDLISKKFNDDQKLMYIEMCDFGISPKGAYRILELESL